ncbi:Ubiquitin-conjugating enzyme E2 6 [Saitoella coloradoensis]
MASKAAYKRLTKEYLNLQQSPPPYISAHPSDRNILEWHFIITGPPSTPYSGGQYHGTLVFPSEYPFKPPAIRMHTPSGRFVINSRICLSISDFHPKSWNPSWTVGTILVGLVSFMTGEEVTTGSMNTTVEQRKAYAAQSRAYNARSQKFMEEFPEETAENLRIVAAAAAAAAMNGATANGAATTAAPAGPPAPGQGRLGGIGWSGKKMAIVALVVGYIVLAKFMA